MKGIECQSCHGLCDPGEIVGGICIECLESERQRQIRADEVNKIMQSKSYQMELPILQNNVVYVGIGPESGKRVTEENAFMYAMERCTTDSKDMQEFCDYFTGVRFGKAKPDELTEFRKDLVEWYYSGNWIKEEINA